MGWASTSSIKDPATRMALQKFADKLDQDKAQTWAGMTLTNLTASQLVQTNGSKALASVVDLTVFIAGTTNQISVTDNVGSVILAVTDPFDIPGKLTAGSFASPTDVTATREYGFEIHYSGNNYNATGIRSRASAVTTDTAAQFQGGLFQAANNDNINVGVLNGLVAEAIGKATANAATIGTMRGALIGAEWSAKDTITDLRTLHVRTHTRDSATEGYFSNSGYGLYIENEAVGGNGQALTAGIYFKGTNLSAGNKAFTYGIDFSGGTFATAEIRFSNGETIDNLTDGRLNFGSANLLTTGTLGVGVATLATGTTIGTLTLANGSITDSVGTISFGNEELVTTGTLRATSIRTSDGTATTPSHTFTGDSDTGMWRVSANKLAFSVEGVQQLIITSTGVGIGTNVPTTLLNVWKDQNAGTAIYVRNDTSGTGAHSSFVVGSTSKMYMYQFCSAYTENLWLKPDASVFQAAGSGGFNLVTSHASGIMRFYTAGNNLRGIIDASGNWKLGDGGTTNYLQIGTTGDLSFVGSAGFYPRRISQSAIPAAGTGATQIDTGELMIWRDSDDAKIYAVYNDTDSGIKSVEMI